ncbi:hypothetical protein [Prevotella sp. HUN102]|uniref:hypothetical protein n=1 Tax=Prevotella sp. HUN102 TaxID=1392486 RepID=UPI0018CC23DF|nr:hypothetical protein [Prevotella sp. HUN102]
MENQDVQNILLHQIHISAVLVFLYSFTVFIDCNVQNAFFSALRNYAQELSENAPT